MQSCEFVAVSFLTDEILLSVLLFLAYQKVAAWGMGQSQLGRDCEHHGMSWNVMECLLAGSLHARAPIHRD